MAEIPLGINSDPCVAGIGDIVTVFGMSTCALVIAFDVSNCAAVCYHWPSFDIESDDCWEKFIQEAEDGLGPKVFIVVNPIYDVNEFRRFKELYESKTHVGEAIVQCKIAKEQQQNFRAEIAEEGEIKTLNAEYRDFVF